MGQYDGPKVWEKNASLLDDEDLQRAAAKRRMAQGPMLPEASMEAKGQNPNALEYGTKQAQIEEFYITDDRGFHQCDPEGQYVYHPYAGSFYGSYSGPHFAFSVKTSSVWRSPGTFKYHD